MQAVTCNSVLVARVSPAGCAYRELKGPLHDLEDDATLSFELDLVPIPFPVLRMGVSIELGPAQYNDTKVGWVNEPDGRGTLSILVSCLSSLFLSSWAVMHLNIPQTSSNSTRRLAIYFYWCIYGIFGPELVIWTAWRQLLSAWALRNQLREDKVCTSS